jgi:hypothetical protein
MFFGLIALLIVLLLVLVLFGIVKRIFILAVNSVIGIFALIGYNYLFSAGIEVNFWSAIITAIGGIFGFIIVLIAHYLHIAF